MVTHKHWLIAATATLLLGGCAEGPQPMYTWGNYQPTIYQYFQKEKGSPEEQIVALNQIIEKARADNRPVPPGLYAHQGLLYAHLGKGADARQAFITEKTLYPESGPYMDFLLTDKERKQ